MCLLIFSCRKDIRNFILDRDAPPSSVLESAQAWHSQHIDVDATVPLLRPHWNDAWMVKATDSSSLLIVSASDKYVRSGDISIRRLFVFKTAGGSVTDGKIVELVGKKYNVKKNTDFLLKNYNQDHIDKFNGGIFQYDINYRSISNATFENGQRSNKFSHIMTLPGKSKVNQGKPKMTLSGESCAPVTPTFVNWPLNLTDDCEVTVLHTVSYNTSTGCAISETYTMLAYSCPVDDGSGSGSGSSGDPGDPNFGGGGIFVSQVSCKSFAFKRLSPSANSQECGVSGLFYDLRTSYGTVLERIPFRTIYINASYTRTDGTILTPGFLAEQAANAATLAGAYLENRYRSTIPPPSTQMDAIFAEQMENNLRYLINGYAAIRFAPTQQGIPVNTVKWIGQPGTSGRCDPNHY